MIKFCTVFVLHGYTSFNIEKCYVGKCKLLFLHKIPILNIEAGIHFSMVYIYIYILYCITIYI